MRERLYRARRAAHVGRLTDRGLSPEAAERALAAWEVEAASVAGWTRVAASANRAVAEVDDAGAEHAGLGKPEALPSKGVGKNRMPTPSTSTSGEEV